MKNFYFLTDKIIKSANFSLKKRRLTAKAIFKNKKHKRVKNLREAQIFFRSLSPKLHIKYAKKGNLLQNSHDFP